MAAQSGSVLVTWEKFDDCGEIGKQFKEITKQPATKNSLSNWPLDQKEPGKKNANTFQPIKILQRKPNSDTCLTKAPSRSGPSRPIKTLEEREAAYAEARLRILGPTSHAESNGAVTNCLSDDNPRRSGAAKVVVEPNMKIMSNSVRHNGNGKT